MEGVLIQLGVAHPKAAAVFDSDGPHGVGLRCRHVRCDGALPEAVLVPATCRAPYVGLDHDQCDLVDWCGDIDVLDNKIVREVVPRLSFYDQNCGHEHGASSGR